MKTAALITMVLAVLAAGALGVTAATRPDVESGGPLPAAAGAGEEQEVLGEGEVKKLLAERTKALKSGDESAFLSAFSEDIRDEQGKVFRNLKKVPFAQAEYTIASLIGSANDRFGSGAALTIDILFVHQIKDVDVRPVGQGYRWRLEKDSADSAPVVTKVSGAPKAIGRATSNHPAPWDLYDDMYVSKQRNTLTIADKKHTAKAKTYAAHAQKAAGQNLAAWNKNAPADVTIPTSYLLVFEPDRRTYGRLFLGDDATTKSWEAGHAIPMFSHPEGENQAEQFAGSRIAIDSSREGFRGKDGDATVLEISRHEIAHGMVAPLDGADYRLLSGPGSKGPASWVVEGFAEYMDKRPDHSRADPEIEEYVTGVDWEGLPDQDAFNVNCEPDRPCSVATDYLLSYLAIRFMAEKAGEAKTFTFVAEHYQDPEQLDTQLETAMNMDTQQFEKAWARYVRNES